MRIRGDGPARAVRAGQAILDGVRRLGIEARAGVHTGEIELRGDDASTHELTRLTDNDWDDDTPTWTADGQSLIFMSPRDGDEDLWKMPVESPGDAIDLIDDAGDPSSETMPDCFWGVPEQ